MNTRRSAPQVAAAILIAATLSACTFAEPGGPTPTRTPSSSPTASASPTPTATPTPTPPPATTPPAPPVDDPPARVVGLTAITGGGSGEVLLTWTPNPESDIDYYIVMRSDSPGGARTRLGTMTPEDVALFPLVPFVDSNATVGYYRVRAVDNAGQQGSSSAEVCGASVGHSC